VTGREIKLVVVAVVIALGLMLAYNATTQRATPMPAPSNYTNIPVQSQPGANSLVATYEAQDRDRKQREFEETTNKNICEASGGRYTFGYCNTR